MCVYQCLLKYNFFYTEGLDKTNLSDLTAMVLFSPCDLITSDNPETLLWGSFTVSAEAANEELASDKLFRMTHQITCGSSK